MKLFLKLIFFYFLLVKLSYGNENLYETVFHKIEITNKDFTQSKIKKIEEIKIISLENILYRILTKHNFKNMHLFLKLSLINNEHVILLSKKRIIIYQIMPSTR